MGEVDESNSSGVEEFSISISIDFTALGEEEKCFLGFVAAADDDGNAVKEDFGR